MLIVYDSRTGNVDRFIKSVGMEAIRLYTGLVMTENFILVTYTTGFGKVPPSTASFLELNKDHLKAVAVSGNKNWGDNFGKAGDIIATEYKVPLIHKFELSGSEKDVSIFTERVQKVVNQTY